MGTIGQPNREIEFEPIEEPVPEPVPVPEEVPEEVPA
jgi:hypothetical protein